MPRKKVNSVACSVCHVSINEPQTEQAIREKLRAMGWRFIEVEGKMVGKCGICCIESKCSFYRPARFTGKLEDMVSPYSVQ